VVGSRARRDHPADEWADLDLVIFTTDLSKYASTQGWLSAIGPAWVSVLFERGDDWVEHLVLFDGGRKVDFAFSPLDALHALAQSLLSDDVYRRGYRVILDKDGLTTRLPPPPYTPLPGDPPSAGAFRQMVEAFWYGATHVARHIRRRQLWVVKLGDAAMKAHLLTLLEWHARATHGWDIDTWHDGRFLAEWADPATWAALHAVFGRFDAADSWRALRATMDLFRRLATETARRLGMEYPAALDDHVTQYVNRLYTEDTL
jgi:aminoglycoside 6-adenylyltransferase